MKIAIGNDHRGVKLKHVIQAHFKDRVFQDVGSNHPEEKVDYPDFAKKVCESILSGESKLGILICGSGIGMSMAANKFHGIRAAMVWNPEVAKMSRQHNDANVLCLSSDFTDEKKTLEIVETWLNTEFEGGRHKNRVDKLKELEK